MNGLEIVLQIISILIFLGGGITFFFKTGSYKSAVDNQIHTLQEDVVENKNELKELKEDFEKIKIESNRVTSHLETLLIEVKTKLELLMQFSSWNKGNERNKK